MSCIGGAELGQAHDDGSFDAKLTVKFGGLRVAFSAVASLELDDAEHAGRLAARGADKQGGTRVRSDATFRVAPAAPHSSAVALGGEVTLSGKLASLIEAGAGVVVARMTREFAAALSTRCAELESPTPAAAAEAASAAAGLASIAAADTPEPAAGAPVPRLGLWARLVAWLTGRSARGAQGSRS
jgi:carbon monoxide dehydrogenase subunit G